MLRRIRVHKAVESLDHGMPVDTTLETLYDGPGYISSPKHNVERALAIERAVDAVAYIHTPTELWDATHVKTFTENDEAVLWLIVNVAVAGYEWRLTLRRLK